MWMLPVYLHVNEKYDDDDDDDDDDDRHDEWTKDPNVIWPAANFEAANFFEVGGTKN